jgi:tetratricopeptide (TPR) repeat protein
MNCLAFSLALLAIGQPPGSSATTPVRIDLDRVVAAASSIPHDLPRAWLLAEVSAVRARRGEQEAARTLARQAQDLIRKAIDAQRDGGGRGYLLVQLALLQNKLGDRAASRQALDRAIDAARRLDRPNQRRDLHQFIAHTMSEIGDFEEAAKRTEILTPGGEDSMALKDIGKERARAGDLSGARRMVGRLRLLASRERAKPPEASQFREQVLAGYALIQADVLAEVALAETRRDGGSDTRETLRQALALIDPNLAQRPDLAVEPLATIALARAKLGEAEPARQAFERALRTARKTEPFPGAELLAHVADAQLRAGEEAEARKTLAEAFERARPLDNGFPQVNDIITETQLKAGDLDGALRTARAARNVAGRLTLRPQVLRELIKAQALATSPQAAFAEWEKVAISPEQRAYALLGAADAGTPPTVPDDRIP